MDQQKSDTPGLSPLAAERYEVARVERQLQLVRATKLLHLTPALHGSTDGRMNRVSRFNRFANGDLSEPIAWLMMYEKNRRLQFYADTEDNRQRRATRLAHESGGITKAASALISPAPSPRNNDTLEHLRNLHPNEDAEDIAAACVCVFVFPVTWWISSDFKRWSSICPVGERETGISIMCVTFIYFRAPANLALAAAHLLSRLLSSIGVTQGGESAHYRARPRTASHPWHVQSTPLIQSPPLALFFPGDDVFFARGRRPTEAHVVNQTKNNATIPQPLDESPQRQQAVCVTDNAPVQDLPSGFFLQGTQEGYRTCLGLATPPPATADNTGKKIGNRRPQFPDYPPGAFRGRNLVPRTDHGAMTVKNYRQSCGHVGNTCRKSVLF